MRIRPTLSSDAGQIAAIYDPIVRDTTITFETEPVGEAGFVERIANVSARMPYLTAEIDGRVAGYAYASPHRKRAAYRWAVETSIFVSPDFHRRGVGRALVQALLRELTDLGYVTAWAGIGLPNEGSVGLHESLGFAYLGTYEAVGFKQGQWVDVAWFRLALRDLPVVPEEPRAWDRTAFREV